MRVLVVDDERNIRHTLRVCLEGLGCEVREAATQRPRSRRSLKARRTWRSWTCGWATRPD
ncbi:response regulator [Corallococcus exiguus]|uniref:response regulator n=1 Tax=Corallococcus exiguus TaxID=83462 RepID=UPI001A8DF06B|nr:response regulator [Corallococcus exiguus]MBN8473149.1 response regulator [Corallococcus exiguus]